jgi:uncharacterized membrane protein required for colicin V production
VSGYDAILAALVVLGAAWGAWRGALRLVSHVAALAVAVALPWQFAGPLAHALEQPLQAGFLGAYAFAAGSLALLGYVLVRLSFWIPIRLRKNRAEEGPSMLGALDRAAGAVVGAFQVALVAWIALSLVALVQPGLGKHGVKLGVADAELYRLADRHNAVGLVLSGGFADLKGALDRAKQAPAASAGKALEELRKDGRFQAIVKDDGLRKALREGNVAALARSPQLMSLVSDAKTRELLAQVAADAATQVQSLLEQPKE